MKEKQKTNKVKAAELQVEAARLRSLAATNQMYSASYRRQARKPIYNGQDAICLQKAAESDAFADQRRAEANLLDCQAAELDIQK